MGTQPDTIATETEPAVPFARPKIALQPPGSVFACAIRDLEAGESVAFRRGFAPPASMERYVRLATNKHCKLQLQVLDDRYVVTKAAGAKRGKGISEQLLAMEIGQTIEIDDRRPGSVRSVASLLMSGSEPMAFHVSEIGHNKCTVTRIEPGNKTRNRWGKYKFSNIGPGGQFTVPADQHSGIETMRSACTYHSKASEGLKFFVRQNIDGSVTVRCYAEGAMPPKWLIERDHAKMQEAIQAQAPGSGSQAG